ncbi:unnamed protein product [Prorocentrum cordatum]|uniref:Xrn1 N-terminal domain-containing protein n=1 Tax=Prorocentrum cordatum TaxID=2364126 RepID=A0ABN9WCJ0_9DINO|nr:unnamed protein product [Polarella glacialis]
MHPDVSLGMFVCASCWGPPRCHRRPTSLPTVTHGHAALLLNVHGSVLHRFSGSRVRGDRCLVSMGIPGYSSFLRQAYPDVFVKLDAIPWEHVHLYFDLNHVLHGCTGRMTISSAALTDEDVQRFIDDVLSSVFWYLDSVEQSGVSVSSLTLCVDGPPSVKKLQEQRERRRSRIAKKADAQIAGGDLIGLALTPGTDVMDALCSQLPEGLRQRQAEGKLRCPVAFWDANAPGEGEHRGSSSKVPGRCRGPFSLWLCSAARAERREDGGQRKQHASGQHRFGRALASTRSGRPYWSASGRMGPLSTSS